MWLHPVILQQLLKGVDTLRFSSASGLTSNVSDSHHMLQLNDEHCGSTLNQPIDTWVLLMHQIETCCLLHILNSELQQKEQSIGG